RLEHVVVRHERHVEAELLGQQRLLDDGLEPGVVVRRLAAPDLDREFHDAQWADGKISSRALPANVPCSCVSASSGLAASAIRPWDARVIASSHGTAVEKPLGGLEAMTQKASPSSPRNWCPSRLRTP